MHDNRLNLLLYDIWVATAIFWERMNSMISDWMKKIKEILLFSKEIEASRKVSIER